MALIPRWRFMTDEAKALTKRTAVSAGVVLVALVLFRALLPWMLLALAAYWHEVGGLTMLPGTNRAADRFARATFYVTNLPQTSDPKRAVAQIFSVIRNASVPLGFTVPDKPNIASTIWRTAYDQKNRTLYFDSAISPTVFSIDIDGLALEPGAPVKRLPLRDGQTYSGDATASLVPAEPFAFLPAKTD